jgi:hypothetical protein
MDGTPTAVALIFHKKQESSNKPIVSSSSTASYESQVERGYHFQTDPSWCYHWSIVITTTTMMTKVIRKIGLYLVRGQQSFCVVRCICYPWCLINHQIYHPHLLCIYVDHQVVYYSYDHRIQLLGKVVHAFGVVRMVIPVPDIPSLEDVPRWVPTIQLYWDPLGN